MRNSPVIFALSAAAFACLDLAHKASAEATSVHPRSAAYVVVVLGLGRSPGGEQRGPAAQPLFR